MPISKVFSYDRAGSVLRLPRDDGRLDPTVCAMCERGLCHRCTALAEGRKILGGKAVLSTQVCTHHCPKGSMPAAPGQRVKDMPGDGKGVRGKGRG